MTFKKEKWLNQLCENKTFWPFLANYLIVQSKHSYVHYFSHPLDLTELILKASYQYALPAKVLPMDLTMEAECFGPLTIFHVKSLPQIISPVTLEDIVELGGPKFKSNRYHTYVQTVENLAASNDDPTIAFVTGPFTILAQLVSTAQIKDELINNKLLKEALDIVTEFLISYIQELKDKGLSGFIFCEPYIQVLSKHQILKYSTNYIETIKDKFPELVFGYHSCIDNVSKLHPTIAKLNPDIVSVGNDENLTETFNFVLDTTVVIGNISPVAVLVKDDISTARIKMHTELEKYRNHPNFIPGFSCAIPPNSKKQNLEQLVAFFNKAAPIR